MVNELNKNEFEEKVLKSDKVVIVDFYATWCGPCKVMSTIIDEVAKEAKDFIVYKLDVDDADDLAREYGIMSIPCIISFKDGKELKRYLNIYIQLISIGLESFAYVVG